MGGGRHVRSGRVPGGQLRAGRPRAGRPAILVGVAVLIGGLAVAIGYLVSRPAVHGASYSALASRGARTLERTYYNGAGRWHMCLPATVCGTKNQDWGADALTYALYFRWKLTGDRAIVRMMRALAATAHTYGPGYRGWSDVPMWDAVADAREYQVTGDKTALAKAEAAFAVVDRFRSASFARGACPSIDYQQPGGGPNKLKTLETDSNYIKAALLLHQITGRPGYLLRAEAKYGAVRRYFLDRHFPLYTVYVFDNGSACTALPGRFYASVNGNMIWSGQQLARYTGRDSYLRQAVATARAVARHLGDGTGVFADLQAENDVVEPLVEAMYGLATNDHRAFARYWLLTAAGAAAAARSGDGGYGRFFDGPPPVAPVTAWQVNGGLAVEQAASALDPRGVPAGQDFWRQARFRRADLVLARTPIRITFTGRAIAIIGTLGDVCCEQGHAQVVIDGRSTFDRTGIWQNKSSSARRLRDTVLFAWRWPRSRRHIIEIFPGFPNAKEGGSYFHMTGYYLVR